MIIKLLEKITHQAYDGTMDPNLPVNLPVPSHKQSSFKYILFFLAIAGLVAGIIFAIRSYQQTAKQKADLAFYSQASIPNFLDGIIQEKDTNFISVKASTNQVIKLDLKIPTEVKLLSTSTPAQATLSAKPSFSLTKPAYVSEPTTASIADIKTGDTVSVLFTKDENTKKVTKQEITIIK